MSNGVSAKIELLRARDGDGCWYCGKTINFDLKAPAKLAGTLEHLLAQSLGGTSALDNLVICHAKCNAHLRDHPLPTKRKMREANLRNLAKQAAAKAAKIAASRPATATAPPAAAAPKKPVAPPPAAKQSPPRPAATQPPSPPAARPSPPKPAAKAALPPPVEPPLPQATLLRVPPAARHAAPDQQAPVRLTPIQRWQVFGLSAAAASFFLAGLCLGLLLR